MILESFPVGPFAANCVLVGDPEAGELAVVDPGGDGGRIVERVRATGLEPTVILHTHGHLDHAAATAHVHREFGGTLPVGLHPADRPLYDNLEMQGRMFGLAVDAAPAPDLDLSDGTEVRVGSLRLRPRHAPGHSPGSVVLIVDGAPEPTALVGDVVFAGSIGRTDLWGGSAAELERSIRERVYTLEDRTRLVCGHGPDTTVGAERRSNPFVSG